jgi:4-diphosphocytidyl-2-C-methyl-D-erythritol kinase
MPRPHRVAVRAPAKVNLALSVGPRRRDGYHDLVSVFHAVSLVDEVRAEPAPPGRVTLGITGTQAAAVPRDGTNLAVRAARALADHAGTEQGVALHVTKGIPVAGGMAGGSADAAAALVACDALWGTALARDELLALAADLGADVPFSLVGGTAVGSGRGDRLTPALARGSFHWVFAVTAEGLSTPAVYAELDRLRAESPRRPVPRPTVAEAVMTALRSGDAEALGAALSNDLEPAACSLRPRLRNVLDGGRELGALGAVVSGSGPTCAFLAGDESHALDLAVGLTSAQAAADIRRVTGPVPGARIVG